MYCKCMYIGFRRFPAALLFHDRHAFLNVAEPGTGSTLQVPCANYATKKCYPRKGVRKGMEKDPDVGLVYISTYFLHFFASECIFIVVLLQHL